MYSAIKRELKGSIVVKMVKISKIEITVENKSVRLTGASIGHKNWLKALVLLFTNKFDFSSLY